MERAARILMGIAHVLPVLLGVLFLIGETALTIWLIIEGEWTWLVLSIVFAVPIFGLAEMIAGVVTLPFYGLARLANPQTADRILATWE